MIDRDIYFTNQVVEEFLHALKTKMVKDCPSTKTYISTASLCYHWLYKQYIIDNNKEQEG